MSLLIDLLTPAILGHVVGTDVARYLNARFWRPPIKRGPNPGQGKEENKGEIPSATV